MRQVRVGSFLLALAATTFVLCLVAAASWWDDAEWEDDDYRVVGTSERFCNEGLNEGGECDWECTESRSTDWRIKEYNADVK